jgi:redox-sensitive bicupin YhaK (pirin superfamily)
MLDIVIDARKASIGPGMDVKRILPFRMRRMVGPFIFMDHAGPVAVVPEKAKAMDVLPHPHIGLSTVSYLFGGQVTHRDSLGVEQIIKPGEVNWMTAGSGIAHSERTPQEIRNRGADSEMFGIQTWVALPIKDEESDPEFFHYEADALPLIEAEGKQARLIAGSLYGIQSPVKTFSEMFYADVLLESGAKLQITAEYEERAVYIVEGSINISPADGSSAFKAGQLLILKPKEEIIINASTPARLMLLGGAPMDEVRHIWWNFVSSSKERIEQAKEDWREQRFQAVPEETERIPLPADSRPVVARYP